MKKEQTLISCVNNTWTTNHQLNPATGRTICGLKFTSNPAKNKNCVWIPNAIFFSAGHKCKRCYKNSQ